MIVDCVRLEEGSLEEPEIGGFQEQRESGSRPCEQHPWQQGKPGYRNLEERGYLRISV
jgi:hypothetical protein